MALTRIVRYLRPGEEGKHLAMLNLCFGRWGDARKWRRRYIQPGFDITKHVLVVEEDGEWAGGVTIWPRTVKLKNGRKVIAYIPGGGYVHPKHRGKGIYSTFMKRSLAISRDRGASFAIAFVFIYGVPPIALPKYGFIDAFHVKSRLLVLKPGRLLEHMLRLLEMVYIPIRSVSAIIEVELSYGPVKRRGLFRIVEQRLVRMSNMRYKANVDLTIKMDVYVLLKLHELIRLNKKRALIDVIGAVITGRLKIRPLKALMRLLLRRFR